MSTAVLFKVVFGESLKEAMKKGEGWKIPILIHKATDYIKSKVTVSSGIFKVAASKWKVQKLKEEFERGAVGLSKYNDPHSVAALLILYLTSLPDSLLSPQQQQLIRESYRSKTGEEFIVFLRTTIHKSGLPNKLLLKYLLLFLHNVLSNFSTNKVDAPTLALAWAPVFFPLSVSASSSPAPDGSIQAANTKEDVKITEIILENYSLIWESGEKKGNGSKIDSSLSSTSSQPVSHPLSRSPLPTPSHPSSSSPPIPTNSKTLSVTTNGTDKRAHSPGGPRPARPGSALSSTSTVKSHSRGQTPPLSKAANIFFDANVPPPKSTTPSKLTKLITAKNNTNKKKAPSPTPTPIRSNSPALPRNTQASRSRTPPSRTLPVKKNTSSSSLRPPSRPLNRSSPSPSPSPSPAPSSLEPPPLPINKQPVSPTPSSQGQSSTIQSPSPCTPTLALMRSASQVLHGLVDTELHISDFRAPDGSHIISASEKGAETDENEVEMGTDEEGSVDYEESEEEEEKVEGKSSLIYQENDVLFNNRLSGSFVSIPKLKLEMVLPYDFQSAPKKKNATKSTKTKSTAATTKTIIKKQITTLPAKPNNKMLNVPKAEYNSRSPSPQPKPRPHSSHTLSRSSISSSPTTPLRSHHSPHPPSSAPSRALKSVPEDSEREKKKDKKAKDKEKGGDEELLAKNKALEAEILVLRAKIKDDEEKLANEEKNVTFLLSRVEILDRQRMEAVNKIIDEKSIVEKELRVRISTLEAEALVLKEQMKLTESSAEVKSHSLSQHSIELEARVTLLQAQLDRAYEEIAEKDNRLAELRAPTAANEEVDVVVLDQQYIDTPKPPLDNAPFFYHHPFAQQEPKINGHTHPKHEKHAWKPPAIEEFGDVSL